MASDGGVSAALAGAKKALDAANRSNVSTRSGHPFGQYTVAREARKSAEPTPRTSTLSDEARSAGEGIKARMETEAATRKALEQ